ncbi:hypothetical protein [Caballeronia sp. INML3B]|uniref:hypothetical protein n=1 Tax=Caballeronia sp. INML3B TaxID=2921749 RepID=UPI0020285016|nr:hypothetical protein [Caballeronia sp. INML3B]
MADQKNPCDLPCTKCGSTDVMRRFWPKGEQRQAKKYDGFMSRFVSVSCWSATAQRDHIVHHCRCCQFEWSTPPMTARKAA